MLAAGQRLGPYEIVSPLGAGGMGEVWLASDPTLKRRLAIKVLRDTNSVSFQRFLQEARAAATLNHPNIVGIYEAREVDGIAYIAMEFVEGEPLTAKMKPKRAGSSPAIEYLTQIARALEAAHAAGIIHRDVKPANVMVSPSGFVKLLDFGLAKRLPTLADTDATATATLTEHGHIVGTYAYMSPEQAQGLPVDARTDIFSFGALAYELLTGRRPFSGDTPISTLGAIVHSEPVPLTSGSSARIPAELQRIVMRCLRKDPSRRFQTAADLRAALEDLTAGDGLGATAAGRRLLIPALAASVLLAFALAIGWYSLARKQPAAVAPVRQITFDGTLNVTPTYSPDGNLLAFASDRGGRDNLDIWVRQTAGGALIRLTAQPGVEAYPQFSPDGTKVFFLSGSQTIYEVASLGGPSREVLADAGPFSVSARGEIAYVKMRPGTFAGPIFVYDGKNAVRWSSCVAVSRPAWSADGNEIIFFGNCGSQRGGFRGSRSGGDPIFISDFGRLQPWVSTFAAEAGNGLVFVAQGGRELSRWFRGGVQPVTIGTSWQGWPAVSPSGEVVYSQHTEQIEVRHLALPGEAKSIPVPVVAAVGHFAASRDGGTLVYGRLTGGRSGELVVRNLLSGEERVFASHDLLGVSFGSLWPQVSPSGDQVVYRVVGENGGTYLLRLPGGEVRRLATLDEFQLASDWSADGSRVLGECAGRGAGICALNPNDGSITTVLVHPEDQLIYPSPSWDGRRIVFQRRRPGGISGIWIARIVPGETLEPDAAWIRISPEGTDCSRPRFSSDGSAVYFVMGRDGLRLLARQRLDARTAEPEGEVELAIESPVEIPILDGGTGPYPLISVTRRGLFYSSFIARGNLYMTEIR